MDRPKVLFVTEKWPDGNPELGLTNNTHNLFGSLKHTKLADFHCIHFDEFFRLNGKNADEFILRSCQTDPPSVIIFSFLFGSCFPLNPTLETVRSLGEAGIPLVFMWFDMFNPAAQEISEKIAPFSKLNVCLDTLPPRTKYPKKFITMWVPQDESLFFNPEKFRDLDVSFLGARSDRYPDRVECLNYLKKAGHPGKIPFYKLINRAKGLAWKTLNGLKGKATVSFLEKHDDPKLKFMLLEAGGQRKGKLTVQKYASIHQRSKISLNFSRAVSSNLHQPKGRIYEIMACGSMLLESTNEEIKRWYLPGVHYVPFENPKHCFELIQHYLKNEDERKAIAFNGWKKTTECYNAFNFWKKIFEIIQLC